MDIYAAAKAPSYILKHDGVNSSVPTHVLRFQIAAVSFTLSH